MGTNSSRPTTAQITGGVYNAVAPAPNDGQACALQLDTEGNLLVNVAVGGGGGGSNASVGLTGGNVPGSATYMGADNPGGKLTGLAVDNLGNLLVNVAAGSGGNAAAGLTGSTVPLSADYLGFNSGGNLIGVSSANPLPVAQQGTVTIAGSVSVSNFPATQPVSGTVTVQQSTGANLHVDVDNFPATQTVSGTVTANAGTGTFTTSDTHYPASVALSDALANPTTTEIGANLLGWDATNTVWRRVQVDTGTGTLKVDGSGSTQPISGTVSLSAGTAVKILDAGGINNLAVNASGQIAVSAITNALPAGTNLLGQIEVTDGTNILFTSGHAGFVQFPSAQAVTQSSGPWTVTDQHTYNQDASNNLGVNVENFPASQLVVLNSIPLAQNAANQDYQERAMYTFEAIRRALVALACEGGRNNPSDFSLSMIEAEAGADSDLTNPY